MDKPRFCGAFFFRFFSFARVCALGNTYATVLTQRRAWALNDGKGKDAGRIVVKIFAIVLGLVALLAR